MEETEAAKEWFVTHEGKQFGPVSLDDLRFEMERDELNPRRDMVWKKGMEDWIPAGDVEGLFVRKEVVKAADHTKETAFTESEPEVEIGEEEKELTEDKWAGVGRDTYFFVCYILPFLWVAGVGFGTKFLEGKVGPGLLGTVGVILFLVPVFLAIAAILMRFQNLRMSRAWFFGLFAPLLNFWVSYRLFACPPGYADHKKLDPIGWVLAIIHWVSVALLVAAFGFAAYTLNQSAEDDPTRLAIEGYIEQIKEARKAKEAR